MHEHLDRARELERDLVDRIAAATRCHELCERRVRQLEMAITSDLFEEFEEDDAALLHRLAASVRIKHDLLPKHLADAKRIADECDEILAAYETNGRLGDEDGRQRATERMKDSLAKLNAVHRRSEIVCTLVKEQEQAQLSVFERMRR